MKKNILILCGIAGVLALSGCTTNVANNTATGTTQSGTSGAVSEVTTGAVASGVIANGSRVQVDYTLRVESGGVLTVVDTSRESEATDAIKSAKSNIFAPLDFIMGGGQMLPAFEEELMGMKAGESKQFTLSAEDGYGGAYQSEWVNEELFQPIITQKVEKYQTTSVNTTYWTNNGKDVPQVGESVSDESVTGVVLSVNNDIVLVRIEVNFAEIFGSGFTEVGDVTEVNGNTVTLKSIDLDGITVDIDNSRSPFAGKEIVPGTTAEIPPATGTGESTIARIEKIEDGKVLLVYPSIPNTHPLAGKELNFDVMIVSVQ